MLYLVSFKLIINIVNIPEWNMPTDLSTPTLGIIGGAGPMAGALLFQKIIQICQEKYHCQEDDDFPYIVLLSYPFADSLISEDSARLVKEQLTYCLKKLEDDNVKIAAIACNTLHDYLDVSATHKFLLVHMIEEAAQAMTQKNVNESLVLCSMSSAKSKIHEKYFNCIYPNENFQKEIYRLMNKILAGEHSKEDAIQLAKQLNNQLNLIENKENKIGLVLGCTEYSVLHNQFPLDLHGIDKRFIIFDTTQIVAEKVCQIMFESS